MAAEAIGAEIVQMSMKYWPQELAQKLGHRVGVRHELQRMPDEQISEYLANKLTSIEVQEFLTGVSAEVLEQETELAETAEEVEAFDDEV